MSIPISNIYNLTFVFRIFIYNIIVTNIVIILSFHENSLLYLIFPSFLNFLSILPNKRTHSNSFNYQIRNSSNRLYSPSKIHNLPRTIFKSTYKRISENFNIFPLGSDFPRYAPPVNSTKRDKIEFALVLCVLCLLNVKVTKSFVRLSFFYFC